MLQNTNVLSAYFDDECVAFCEYLNALPEHPNRTKKFGKIKKVVCRPFATVVTEDDKVFLSSGSFNSITNWKLYHTSFIDYGSETIIQISASYTSLVMLVQNKYTFNTRVFVVPSDHENGIANLGENVSSFEEDVEIFSNEITHSKANWKLLKDFDLEPGERIVYISCAAVSINFISSKGRLFACGSNQFGELAQPVVSFRTYQNIPKIQACLFDPNNTCKDPFIVKTVNGDHSIIALTRDYKVYYCGYMLNDDKKDLSLMRELQKFDTMSNNECFIDVAATYYKLLLLTNNFNLYNRRGLILNIPKQTGILEHDISSCKLFASSSVFYIIINDTFIYVLPESGSTLNLHHTLTESKSSKSRKTLVLTSSMIAVAYWLNIKESKNLVEQMENLKCRSVDKILSDVVFL